LVKQLDTLVPDVEPSLTVCDAVYQLPLGVEHAALALATCLPAAHVVLQLLWLAWSLADVPLLPYPLVVLQLLNVDVKPYFTLCCAVYLLSVVTASQAPFVVFT
jgi:hypothetical protein